MEYFLIASVEQLYGKDGYVKIKSFSDFPERFLNLEKVFVDFWGEKKSFYIEDVKDIKGKIIIKFKKFDDTRASQVLIGRDIYIDESNSVSLPKDYYYVHDLIGSKVIVEKECIGVVEDVIKGKGNDVLLIKNDNNEEILIPFVLTFIEKFDAAEKKLRLNISKDFLQDDED